MNASPVTWRNDPPPTVGWHIASTERNTQFLRYWSGRTWSAPVHATDPLEHWHRARNTRGESQFADGIEWTGEASAEAYPHVPVQRRRVHVAYRPLQTSMQTRLAQIHRATGHRVLIAAV